MTTPEAVRIRGGMYDRDKPGWIPDPDFPSGNQGTYLATPTYITPDLAYAVISMGTGTRAFHQVFHVASQLAIPGATREPYADAPIVAAPGIDNPKRYASHFRTKTAARKFMQELANANPAPIPADRTPNNAEIQNLRKWIAETYA